MKSSYTFSTLQRLESAERKKKNQHQKKWFVQFLLSFDTI